MLESDNQTSPHHFGDRKAEPRQLPERFFPGKPEAAPDHAYYHRRELSGEELEAHFLAVEYATDCYAELFKLWSNREYALRAISYDDASLGIDFPEEPYLPDVPEEIRIPFPKIVGEAAKREADYKGSVSQHEIVESFDRFQAGRLKQCVGWLLEATSEQEEQSEKNRLRRIMQFNLYDLYLYATWIADWKAHQVSPPFELTDALGQHNADQLSSLLEETAKSEGLMPANPNQPVFHPVK